MRKRHLLIEENSQKLNTPVDSDDTPIKSTPIIKEPLVSIQNPPFPEILKIDKGVEKQIVFPNYDVIHELKNVCIKIPLLQVIK